MEPVTFQEYREKLLTISRLYDECCESENGLEEFLKKCEENGISREEIQSSTLAELIKNEETTGTMGVAQVTMPVGMERRKAPSLVNSEDEDE